MLPYATSEITKPTSTIDVATHPAIKLVVQPTTAPKVIDIFDAPIGTGQQAAVIGSRPDHPVPRKGIVCRIQFSIPVIVSVDDGVLRSIKKVPLGLINSTLASC